MPKGFADVTENHPTGKGPLAECRAAPCAPRPHVQGANASSAPLGQAPGRNESRQGLTGAIHCFSASDNTLKNAIFHFTEYQKGSLVIRQWVFGN